MDRPEINFLANVETYHTTYIIFWTTHTVLDFSRTLDI